MKDPLFTVGRIDDEKQVLWCPWGISRKDMNEIQEKFKSGQSLEQIADEMNKRWLYRWWRLKESMGRPAFAIRASICCAVVTFVAATLSDLASAFYVLAALAFCGAALAIAWNRRIGG